MRRAVDFLAEALASRGVRHVFGVGGANIEDFYDALHAHPNIEPILAKHEFAATTMADGLARTTNGLGVVMATSGGGALNVVAGLGEAHASRVPLLAIIGQPPSALDGKGAFQDTSGLAGSFDALELFSAVARFCARVSDAEQLPVLLDEAISVACTGGPAVMLLPKDVQQSTLTTQPRPVDPSVTSDSAPAPQPVLEALHAAMGQPVLIIAGDGVARADARTELAALADRLNATVAVAPDARDVFDNHNPRFVGVAGVMGHPGVRVALAQVAVCVLVGTRLPLMVRGGLEDDLARTPLVSLCSERSFVDVSVDVVGDLRADLASIVAALPSRPIAAPISVGPPQPMTVPARGLQGLAYRDAVVAIAESMPDGADIFVDAGNTGSSAVHHLPARRNGRFVVALGMGGMGYSFGAAIGAAFARRRRTYVIAGDGAFLMHGLEVHTAVQYRLPVTFIVFNNDAHAMCVTREQLYYGGGYSYNRFHHTDIGAGMAAMFPGLIAHHTNTLDQLRDMLAATNGSGVPAFVSIDCDPDELPPFQPFIKEVTADGAKPVHVG